MSATETRIPRVDVLGVGVSAIDLPSAVEEIGRWIDQGVRHYVCVTGVHGIMESTKDERLRSIHNQSGLTTPDGMPMVWASRWAGAHHVERVYGPELMLEVCARAVDSGWRFFFYGGAEGVPGRLATRLERRFPGLQVVGTYSPPFRSLTPEEERSVTSMINAASPDIVWVGLSTPKQERWMARNRGALEAPALIGVGAAFNIHAGTLRQAPPWMRRNGLEWLYRLFVEPRRLWKRYLVNNTRFVLAILRKPPRLLGRCRPQDSAPLMSPHCQGGTTGLDVSSR